MAPPVPPRPVERLLSEETFVRSLARTLLAEEEDEVVQRTYVRALEHRASAVRHERAWLARVVRSVVSNLRREASRRATRERRAAVSELVPSSAELAEREDRRRALVGAVDRLPEELRVVVWLRYFENLPPREIANQLGLPGATVWERLRRALVVLRADLDVTYGARSRWLPALVPFATARPPIDAAPLHAPRPSALFVMSTRTKLVAGSLVVALFGVFVPWGISALPKPAARDVAGPSNSPSSSRGAALPTADTALAAPLVDEGVVRSRASAAGVAGASRLGSLSVSVRWALDGAPAASVHGHLARPGSRHPRNDVSGVTGTDGTFTLNELEPGPATVHLLRGSLSRDVVIEPGRTLSIAFELAEGTTLTGRVVDHEGRPVANARVWLSREQSMWGAVVTHSDEAGEFSLRGIVGMRFVAAIASGHAPSSFETVEGADGSQRHLELVLRGPGGALQGTVSGRDGSPIVGAMVSLTNRSVPPPFGTRTDAEGRFRIDGVPTGTMHVRARADGWAPAAADVDVAPGESTVVDLALSRGAALAGVVLDEDGAPVADAEISARCEAARAYVHGRAASDGSYALTELAPGMHVIEVTTARHGTAMTRVTLVDEERVQRDFRLATGRHLHGLLLDEEGSTPLSSWRVQAAATPMLRGGVRVFGEAWRSDETDSEGRFRILNVPEGPLRLLVHEPGSSGLPCLWLDGVERDRGEVVVRVPASARATASIVGELLDAERAPIGGARVSLSSAANYSMTLSGTLSDERRGGFEFGPLPPGRYGVRIDWGDGTTERLETVELAADERFDLGSLQRRAPGFLSVEVVSGADGADTVLRLLDARGRMLVADLPGDARRPLVPADYVLLARAPGTATTLRRLQVLPGETTNVAIELEPGIEVAVEFGLPEWSAAWSDATLDVEVLDVSERRVVFERLSRSGAGFATRFALSAGSYVVIARSDQGLSAREVLVVADDDEPLERTWELR